MPLGWLEAGLDLVCAKRAIGCHTIGSQSEMCGMRFRRTLVEEYLEYEYAGQKLRIWV